MEKSEVQANFQLLDSYISEFNLNVFEKIGLDKQLEIDANIGFQIVNVNEKDLVGQIELRYEIDVLESDKKLAKIMIVMNALFKGEGDISKKDFERMLKINGATTLSHLCRAYINSATSLSGMPPITMPLINFNEFFKNGVKEENIS